MSKKGLFLVFEGIDGSGTTTQTNLLHNHLKELSKHNDVLTTCEPWKSDEIKTRLEEDKDSYSGGKEIARLYVDDRKRHQEELIIPNLEKGVIVISTRHMLSTFAYQHTQGVSKEYLATLHKDAGIIKPDLTFFLDVDFETARKRIQERGESLEKFEKNPDFIKKLIKNYRNLVEFGIQNPKYFGKILDFSGSPPAEIVSTVINLDFAAVYHVWKNDI